MLIQHYCVPGTLEKFTRLILERMLCVEDLWTWHLKTQRRRKLPKVTRHTQ